MDVRFSTYGVPMIIGEIRRHLRDNNSVRVSRSLRDLAYRAMQARHEIMAKNNKEPTVDDVAKNLQISEDYLILALEAVVEPLNLFELVFSN